MADPIPVSAQEPQLPTLPQTVLPAIGQLTEALGIPRDVEKLIGQQKRS